MFSLSHSKDAQSERDTHTHIQYTGTGKVRYMEKSIGWYFCESAVSGHSCATSGVSSLLQHSVVADKECSANQLCLLQIMSILLRQSHFRGNTLLLWLCFPYHISDKMFSTVLHCTHTKHSLPVISQDWSYNLKQMVNVWLRVGLNTNHLFKVIKNTCLNAWCLFVIPAGYRVIKWVLSVVASYLWVRTGLLHPIVGFIIDSHAGRSLKKRIKEDGSDL